MNKNNDKSMCIFGAIGLTILIVLSIIVILKGVIGL